MGNCPPCPYTRTATAASTKDCSKFETNAFNICIGSQLTSTSKISRACDHWLDQISLRCRSIIIIVLPVYPWPLNASKPVRVCIGGVTWQHASGGLPSGRRVSRQTAQTRPRERRVLPTDGAERSRGARLRVARPPLARPRTRG